MVFVLHYPVFWLLSYHIVCVMFYLNIGWLRGSGHVCLSLLCVLSHGVVDALYAYGFATCIYVWLEDSGVEREP